MKRISKKLLCLFAALTLTFSIGGCGKTTTPDGGSPTTAPDGGGDGGGSDTTNKPVLKMWHITASDAEGNRTILLNAIKEAEEKFNVKIEETGTENEQYKTKIKSAMASNTGPDIFFTWAAGFSQPFVDGGKVLPLDEYLGDAKDKLLTGITDNFTYNGKVYGIPYQMQVAPLFCNTELFEKYNVKIPETYDELLEAVRVFKDNGVTPIICGAKDLWPAMFYYNVLALRTAGAQMCNDALSGKASYDSPEFIDAAAKLVELTKAGAFGPNAMSVSWDNANVDFAQGKGAMLFNGNWVAGNVSAETSTVNGKIVARKFPIVEGGKGKATEYLGGAGDGYMINSQTKDPKLAAEVLLFICEKLAFDMYEANTGLPGWKVEVDESKISPLTKEISDMTKDSTGWTLWWDVFLEGAAADTHKNLVVELIAGEITPEDFAKQMQKLNEK
jgi:raffinose/stachyose/melibiose transport system substrate-binding protein